MSGGPPCTRCKKKTELAWRWAGQDSGHWAWRWCWSCPRHTHHHDANALSGSGVLKQIKVTHWTAFIHFIILLKSGAKWSLIHAEMETLYGVRVESGTLVAWRRRYQDALKAYLLAHGGLKVGGRGCTVVIDETVFGSWSELHEQGLPGESSARVGRSGAAAKAKAKSKAKAKASAKTPARLPRRAL